MRFHGITMVGRFTVQVLSTLPTWTTSDVGRMLFVIATNNFYVGGNDGWITLRSEGTIVDSGTAIDKIAGVAFTDREYILKAINGQLTLAYDLTT